MADGFRLGTENGLRAARAVIERERNAFFMLREIDKLIELVVNGPGASTTDGEQEYRSWFPDPGKRELASWFAHPDSSEGGA